MGVLERTLLVFLLQLSSCLVKGSEKNDVSSASGKIIFSFPYQHDKVQSPREYLHLHIASSIYNGTVPISMKTISIPVSHRNSLSDPHVIINETYSCHYKAHRSMYGSFSLCYGIKGFLRFSTFGIHIESPESTNKDFLSQLAVNLPYAVNIKREEYKDYRYRNHRRLKRSAKSIRFSASTPFVVKLYIAADDKLTRSMGTQKLKERVIHIMNLVNGAYHDLGVVFAIVGLELWGRPLTRIDVGQPNFALNNLEEYKRENAVIRRADCFHMLIGETYRVMKGERIGRATNEKMCSVDQCVGFSIDSPKRSDRDTALVVAHELGHNFGMSHDRQDTDCQSCIMSPLITEYSSFDHMKLSWSEKSHETMEDILSQGLRHCIGNDNLKPKYLELKAKSCGNGIVEEGEECDCGTARSCSRNRCCDRRTCRLVWGAECATGLCCDNSTCRYRPRSTTCRPSAGVCDYPEYCDGKSEYCPSDVYHLNGRPCENKGKAYCANGICATSQSRCQELWGLTAIVGSDKCFDKNLEVHHFGHCLQKSRTRLPARAGQYPYSGNNKVIPCTNQNKMCGRLWCDHKNIKPMIYGVLGVFEVRGSGNGFCSAVVADFGAHVRDYGLVPDGAACGAGMMCYNSSCISTQNFSKGKNCSCNGRGACNSHGNCHCQYGSKPPDCKEEGTGGSIDSGPPPSKWQSVPATVVVLIILSILFCAVIGFVIIVCVKKRQKLSKIKFQYRSVPSNKAPPTGGNTVEFKTSNGTDHTKTKINIKSKPTPVSDTTKPLNGPPPKPPPKPVSLKINIKSESRPAPSPDTPPLPPYPNEYAIPNGQASEDIEKAKSRPKISSPIFQTSTNLDLSNIPHVKTTVKKKKPNFGNPSFVPTPPRPTTSSNQPPPPPPPSYTKPPLPLPPAQNPFYRSS